MTSPDYLTIALTAACIAFTFYIFAICIKVVLKTLVFVAFVVLIVELYNTRIGETAYHTTRSLVLVNYGELLSKAQSYSRSG
jgi:diacylglycerol kinase